MFYALCPLWVDFKVFRYKTRLVQGHFSRDLPACVASLSRFFLYLVLLRIVNYDSFSLGFSIVKYFHRSKPSDSNQLPNNVRWQCVSEEEKASVFEDPTSAPPFPDELIEDNNYATSSRILHDNVQITRASVYLEDLVETSQNINEEYPKENEIRKVNSSSKLLDMDTAAVSSESESSDDLEVIIDFFENDPTNHPSYGKLCNGPDLSLNIANDGFNVLSTFVQDIENELHNKSSIEPIQFQPSRSLDIEKELNELMGTLRLNEMEEYDNVPDGNQENGSSVNLGYEETESDNDSLCSSMASGWTWQGVNDVTPANNYWQSQRIKSKSFIEKYKLGKFVRGKQRMSMIEFRDKKLDKRTKSDTERFSISKEISDEMLQPPKFLRLAYDRSSVLEPRVTSVISLPSRPHSAIEDKLIGYYTSVEGPSGVNKSSHSSTPSSQLENRSWRVSVGYDDDIDWSWLEDAMKEINSEIQETETVKPALSRVDAGCQTQPDQSWPGDEERMRNGVSSDRYSDTTGVASECRALEINDSCNEAMSGKSNVEGSGPSGVSSWIRQSMRRVRHFNLGEPPRIRSAPPDTLRLSLESDVGESVVNPVPSNSECVTPNELVQNQTRPRSAGNRPQRRQPTRSRPVSAPTRRLGFNEANNVNSTQNQQESVSPTTINSTEAQDNLGYESDSTDRHPSPRGRRRRVADDENEDCEGRSPLGPWPHGLSSVLAGLGCTLGLFNISRFAVLSVHFGSNFIIQFLILSAILGVPLLAFHAALGQTLGAGPVDMWKISPLFQGIGIALLLAQALIGIYSVVGVSWMFVYFRDSFITKQDAYRWAEPFGHYRDDQIFSAAGLNLSYRLENTVPDYLNGVVLQRHGLVSAENAFGHLKFQLTFNLAVIWMIVFVSLSKGLRSYGKVVYVFSLVPVLGILVISSKILGLTPVHRGLFPQTEWHEFFLNTKSWISAVTEVMITWNLLGAATMQVTSHNRATKKLWRDVITITLLTLVVLILAAFLGNTCHQILYVRGYSYFPSSFERITTSAFLRPSGAPLPPSYAVPIRHLPHASLVAGDRVGKPGAMQESGYQVVRLATELVPATLAVLGGDYLSPFWAVLFYFTLILFGVAQQLAIWHCVITGIMAINAPSLKSWETTITFFTCAAGFVLGLPMTTELGVFVVYFLDYCIGGGWWILLLTLMEICAVLMIRGRPYSGENISIALFGKASNCMALWVVPLLTFSWNVIMPVALLIICITIFKSGGYRDLWTWRTTGRDYWPLWAREVGVFVQIVPFFCFIVVALIQCYRYLSTGPPDIFDRIANLYRPNVDASLIQEEVTAQNATAPANATTTANNGTTELPPAEDPPPKYTPPPSYSTATGARIAKMLRQSFRRSVRRIQSVLGPEAQAQVPSRPPPPDYDSVLVEMNQSESSVTEEMSHPAESNNFTAADVAQLLRCSFRRINNANTTSHSSTTNNNSSPQNLVIPPQWDT